MLGACYIMVSDFVSRLRHDKSGVTAIEYGLIAGAISVVIIATVITIGTDLKDVFTSIQTNLASVVPAAPAAGN